MLRLPKQRKAQKADCSEPKPRFRALIRWMFITGGRPASRVPYVLYIKKESQCDSNVAANKHFKKQIADLPYITLIIPIALLWQPATTLDNP